MAACHDLSTGQLLDIHPFTTWADMLLDLMLKHFEVCADVEMIYASSLCRQGQSTAA